MTVQNLFDYLETNKINQTKMIADLNYIERTFYNWKKNRNIPLKNFIEICEYLQISPNELLGHEEQEHPEEEEILLLKSRQIGKKNVKEIIDIMNAIIAIQNKKEVENTKDYRILFSIYREKVTM